MKIFVLTVDSKEIIDFVNDNNGLEIVVDNKSYFQIENQNDIYVIWSHFTNDDVKNDEYLYEFRVFCEQNKNFDLFIFYEPEKMVKYKQTYRNFPIFKLEEIQTFDCVKLKNKILSIFNDNSFVNNEKKLIVVENNLIYNLLKNLHGCVYEFNFVDKSFRSKFKNNICLIM